MISKTTVFIGLFSMASAAQAQTWDMTYTGAVMSGAAYYLTDGATGESSEPYSEQFSASIIGTGTGSAFNVQYITVTPQGSGIGAGVLTEALGYGTPMTDYSTVALSVSIQEDADGDPIGATLTTNIIPGTNSWSATLGGVGGDAFSMQTYEVGGNLQAPCSNLGSGMTLDGPGNTYYGPTALCGVTAASTKAGIWTVVDPPGVGVAAAPEISGTGAFGFIILFSGLLAVIRGRERR
jgi:hypothetical protein